MLSAHRFASLVLFQKGVRFHLVILGTNSSDADRVHINVKSSRDGRLGSKQYEESVIDPLNAHSFQCPGLFPEPPSRYDVKYFSHLGNN